MLERGFALVRDADGKIRRRAADIKAGEGLSLTFADGEKAACRGARGARERPIRTKSSDRRFMKKSWHAIRGTFVLGV